MGADALSDVLRTVRLTGAMFFDVVAKAPWVCEQPPREMILPKILPPRSATDPRRLSAVLSRRSWACHPRPGVAASGMRKQ